MSDETCGDVCPPDTGQFPCVKEPGHDGSHMDAQESTWDPAPKPHFIKAGLFGRGIHCGNAVAGISHHAYCDYPSRACHKDCPELWYERGRHDGRIELKTFLAGRAAEVARRFLNGQMP